MLVRECKVKDIMGSLVQRIVGSSYLHVRISKHPEDIDLFSSGNHPSVTYDCLALEIWETTLKCAIH